MYFILNFISSLELAPESNPMGWMYLAQMISGKESLTSFTNGIRLMKEQIVKCDEETKYNILVNQITKGLVASAELYLTDLCYEDNAESECERLLNEALSMKPNGVEALQSFASMRISQVSDYFLLIHLISNTLTPHTFMHTYIL